MIDIQDIVPVAGYVGKAAKVLFKGKAAQEQFVRDRPLWILRGEVDEVIFGLLRMATIQQLSKLSKEKRADVDTTCGYFTDHAHRIGNTLDCLQRGVRVGVVPELAQIAACDSAAFLQLGQTD